MNYDDLPPGHVWKCSGCGRTIGPWPNPTYYLPNTICNCRMPECMIMMTEYACIPVHDFDKPLFMKEREKNEEALRTVVKDQKDQQG